ncbi:MAG TPA: DUF349 domain-containing protein [Vicinamibacterales bacterium]|nr:DUF349 domain-containing protein [Vicinamibacterales bacterium]
MRLLDKLKPQPRWKHADPSVRFEAVRELEDPAELAILAELDPDARVRRSATARIADPGVLGRIASTDVDPEARDRAADRLLALATVSGLDEAAALGAVSAISDVRRLSVVAKSEAPDAVRGAALSRVTDQRALSSIARHAKHDSTAAAALEQLTDAADLVDVAQNGEHRDVALAALERLLTPSPDIALLQTIEARSQHKAVSRRARTVIHDIETAEAARRAAEEERRRREAAVCEDVERIADLPDLSVARAELSRLTEVWHSLGFADEISQDRFARGVAAAEVTVARRERDAEEAAERARMRAEAIATRDALCQRVETLEIDGDDVPAQLEVIEEEWRSLLPLVGDGPEADRLAARFAQAVAACRKRHEMSGVLVEIRARLESLVAEAEGLPSQDDEAAAVARWQTLSREARGLTATLTETASVGRGFSPADAPALKGRPTDTDHPAPPTLQERLAAVEQAFAARELAKREAAVKAQQDVVNQLQRLAERARRAAEADTITLREGDRLMRDIGAGLQEVEAGRRDLTREVEEAASKLRAVQEKVAPRVRELREMDDWRRFANAQQQEKLIAMAEAIVASLKSDEEGAKTSDLPATARALRELHVKWQEVAEAPRHSAQRLWDRFRTATDFMRSRCETYFSHLREERTTNLQTKAALVEEAEALANSADWSRTAARLQELQAAWQQTGTVPREAGRDLGLRFRAAFNTFFARRREDLATRRKTWTDNLSKKEALCQRAEVLAESTEWDAASAEMKRLQAEWKTVGPVRRSKSEVVWNRFRAAADRFFERYHNRHQIAMAGKIAEREAIVVDLETLAASENGDAPADLATRVQQLRTTWNRSVPVPGTEMRPLADRWQTALTRIVDRRGDLFKGTDLDPAAVRHKMDKLIARVEGYLSDVREAPVGQSQAEILAAKLRSALATNAMGGRSSEDAKWRTAADAVKEAQGAWLRLAQIADPDARALESRFRDVCRRVMDHARRQTSGGGSRRPARPTAIGA